MYRREYVAKSKKCKENDNRDILVAMLTMFLCIQSYDFLWSETAIVVCMLQRWRGRILCTVVDDGLLVCMPE